MKEAGFGRIFQCVLKTPNTFIHRSGFFAAAPIFSYAVCLKRSRSGESA
jgi:hypothetical protein